MRPWRKFSSMLGIQTELRRGWSPSHRHETNYFCPSGRQAETGAGGGCLRGEPRDSLGSKHCPPCRQQPPRRKAFTPWLITRITPETRWVKDTVWCCYSCFRLALWTRKGEEIMGVKEQKRERETSTVSCQEHPSQVPALSCQGCPFHQLFGSQHRQAANPAAATFPRWQPLLPSISTRLDQAGPKDYRTFLEIISETRSPTQGKSTHPSPHKGWNIRVLQWGLWLLKHTFNKNHTFHSSMCYHPMNY